MGKSKKSERIGIEKISQDGRRARVIEYYSCENFIVEFDDGIIRRFTHWHSFENGKFNYQYMFHKAKTSGRIGTKLQMNNGMNAIVKTYRNSHDMDIQFEDGEIAKHVSWRDFENGNIAHPDATSAAKKEQRIYQSKIMNNGHVATVIEYRGWKNNTVKFDNGEIVHNVRWEKFKCGNIALPSSYVKNHIGERQLQKRGVAAEIISCRDANHIDVRFEDGVIVRNRKYADFKKGVIGHPDLASVRDKKDKERLGEIRQMNDGSIGKIISYKNACDIDVDFGENRIARHKAYANFVSGKIRCPGEGRG